MKQKIGMLLHCVLFTLCANSFVFLQRQKSGLWIAGAVLLYLLLLVLPLRAPAPAKGARMALCYHGLTHLRSFWLSCILSTVYHIGLFFLLYRTALSSFVWSAVVCLLSHLLLYGSGMLSVTVSSFYLGVGQRLRAWSLGWIPYVNLVTLLPVMAAVSEELSAASAREERKATRPCATKYPILLVHGVFFRDSQWLNYWGRIPRALTEGGAKIYYGNHPSAQSVEKSGQWLAHRIRQIVAETGCEKVNIIAHSKGGLDCRYALMHCGIAPYVASLTTVNSPHNGCAFADYLLEKAPERVRISVAAAYNTALTRLGDEAPDFLEAVTDLTQAKCLARNAAYDAMPPLNGIFCQSYGSCMNRAKGNVFPLNFTYYLARYFQGANDGLVSEDSFPFGERFTMLRVKGKRGISHADVIDLTRRNIDRFDVIDFYVQLTKDLKERGL